MGNITRIGSIDYSDLVYSSNIEDIHKYKLEKNDLLFNRTNSSEWVGKTAIFKSKTPTIYAGYLIRIRCIIVCPDYVNFVMNSLYHRDWCNQVKTDAVNQSNINAQKLSNFQIPIPPYSEQLRIVNKAKQLLSTIDILDEKSTDLKMFIDNTKSKILDLAISGKLVPQDPADEPAIELLKRINPNFVPCDNSHYENLPNGWCVCRLEDIFEINMGQSPDGDTVNNENGVEFHQGKICFTNEYLLPSGVYTSKPNKIAEANSLLLCVRAPVGILNITKRKICIGRGLCSLKPKYETDNKYWFYILSAYKDYFEQNATGSTFKAISGDTIKNTVVLLPPLNEQIRITKTISSLLSILDTITAELQ